MSAPGLVHIGREPEPVPADRWRELRPRSALLYVVNACHLKCRHCYESASTHPTSARLSLAQYEEVLDDLAELGVLYVTLSGGEIFLRSDVLDIARAARTRRFAVTLYTSGTLIDERRADEIAALRPFEVHVSVYSARAHLHDDFVGDEGAHEKSVRALRLLAERGVRTVLKSNVMTFNVDDLAALAALAEDVGAGLKLDPGMRARTDGDLRPLDWAPPPEVLRRKVLARADLSPQLTERTPDEVCDGTRSLVDPDGALCGAARETLAIGADGGVYGCAFFPRAAGNVLHRSLTEIWRRSPQLDEIRRTTASDLTECGACSLSGACRPCMAQAEIDSGDRRGCNHTSRALAEALYELARRKRTADQRMTRGRQLRVLDAGDVVRPQRGAG